MEKIKIKLKECCLSCENFDPGGIKMIGYSISCCEGQERVIACGHMEVCWKYNTKNLDSQISKKPVNVKKNGKLVFEAECPTCGYSFPDIGDTYESDGEIEQFDFCPSCGQKINWDEV